MLTRGSERRGLCYYHALPSLFSCIILFYFILSSSLIPLLFSSLCTFIYLSVIYILLCLFYYLYFGCFFLSMYFKNSRLLHRLLHRLIHHLLPTGQNSNKCVFDPLQKNVAIDAKCSFFSQPNQVAMEFYSPLFPSNYSKCTECVLRLEGKCLYS